MYRDLEIEQGLLIRRNLGTIVRTTRRKRIRDRIKYKT